MLNPASVRNAFSASTPRKRSSSRLRVGLVPTRAAQRLGEGDDVAVDRLGFVRCPDHCPVGVDEPSNGLPGFQLSHSRTSGLRVSNAKPATVDERLRIAASDARRSSSVMKFWNAWLAMTARSNSRSHRAEAASLRTHSMSGTPAGLVEHRRSGIEADTADRRDRPGGPDAAAFRCRSRRRARYRRPSRALR